jgi:hypothetical protein
MDVIVKKSPNMNLSKSVADKLSLSKKSTIIKRSSKLYSIVNKTNKNKKSIYSKILKLKNEITELNNECLAEIRKTPPENTLKIELIKLGYQLKISNLNYEILILYEKKYGDTLLLEYKKSLDYDKINIRLKYYKYKLIHPKSTEKEALAYIKQYKLDSIPRILDVDYYENMLKIKRFLNNNINGDLLKPYDRINKLKGIIMRKNIIFETEHLESDENYNLFFIKHKADILKYDTEIKENECIIKGIKSNISDWINIDEMMKKQKEFYENRKKIYVEEKHIKHENFKNMFDKELTKLKNDYNKEIDELNKIYKRNEKMHYDGIKTDIEEVKKLYIMQQDQLKEELKIEKQRINYKDTIFDYIGL